MNDDERGVDRGKRDLSSCVVLIKSEKMLRDAPDGATDPRLSSDEPGGCFSAFPRVDALVGVGGAALRHSA
jgi:hypothetical protein